MAKNFKIPAGKDLKLLGVILKTHGYSGTIVMSLSFFPGNEIKEKDPVFVEIDGLPVPFFIEYFEAKSEETAFIKFDDTHTSDKASGFLNCKVFIESLGNEKNSNSNFSLQEMEGYRVTDQISGHSGIIKGIIDLKEHSLMQVESGGREVLVPLHEDLIVSIDPQKKIMVIDAPEGLFDL